MSLDFETSYSGSAQTGLTSPTYDPTVDVAPNSYSKQGAITALGGTQSGVETSSVSSPFTITAQRPANLRSVGTVNPVTGILTGNGRNVYVVRMRKGVVPLSGQSPQTMLIETKISVPAGADIADEINVRAALSAHFGWLNDQSSELGDLVTTGVL